MNNQFLENFKKIRKEHKLSQNNLMMNLMYQDKPLLSGNLWFHI